jgi:hypothetical protein
VKDFHLIHDNNEGTAELRCPMCDEFVPATSCGFNNCVWRMSARKANSRNSQQTEWEAVGNYNYEFEEKYSANYEHLLFQVYLYITTYVLTCLLYLLHVCILS